MIIKTHPKPKPYPIPHPQPLSIMPPPWPVPIWAKAEMLKINTTVKTITSLFILFLLGKIWCDAHCMDMIPQFLKLRPRQIM